MILQGLQVVVPCEEPHVPGVCQVIARVRVPVRHLFHRSQLLLSRESLSRQSPEFLQFACAIFRHLLFSRYLYRSDGQTIPRARLGSVPRVKFKLPAFEPSALLCTSSTAS